MTTADDVWQLLAELTQAQKETDFQLKETDRQLKETNLVKSHPRKEAIDQLKRQLQRFPQFFPEHRDKARGSSRSAGACSEFSGYFDLIFYPGE